MKFSHFFIDRPRFATVLSGLILIFGLLAYFELPVAQYPEISPPLVQVQAHYPGANAETIADTVATPLEQEINGVENMLYMFSQSTNDGAMTLNITFAPGTDVDTAQVLVQNRVSAALPRLPEEVRRRGVTTSKSSPDILMAINLYSPDQRFDELYIANYALLHVSDRINRLAGIGNSQVFGGSEYAMRIWIDPDRLAARDLTPGDLFAALRAQNVQVAGGTLNQPPGGEQDAFELNLETQGRLRTVQEFEQVVVKRSDRGGLVHLKDVARVELGGDSYVTRSYLGRDASVVVVPFLRPGANALDTAERVKETVAEIATDFPPGLEYKVIYNPTDYIEQSIDEVFLTLVEAIVLVVLVIVLFLQSWRTAIIPVIAIPISLVGTFGLMLLFGYSLNMLSLFGLVLAIGIVVDDAIVVVENVERKLREGVPIVAATRQTMDEVGSALIATSLVLVAVFLPTVLLEGISGQFYKQFGVTIAAATLISTVVSLTLSPAMAVIFMRELEQKGPAKGVLGRSAEAFNRGMQRLSDSYGMLVARLARMTLVVSLVYGGLVVLSGYEFLQLPRGFIPAQDQDYTISIIQLPAGASLARTDAVVAEVNDALLALEDVVDTVSFTGFSAGTNSNASNAAAVFAVLKPSAERRELGQVLAEMRTVLAGIDEAFVVTVPPPPVRGMGNAGGFKLMIEDRAGKGPEALEQAAWALAMAANQAPETTSVYTFFETGTPRVNLDIDRERAQLLNIPLARVHETLEIFLGSGYINDFNYLGRSYRVTGQAEAAFRRTPEDILALRVRSNDGAMIPLGSFARVSNSAGPSRLPRYNQYPAAAISGDTAPGFSSGQALARMEALADQVLPPGFAYEWTELAFQEQQVGNSALVIFALAVLFVFLLLAAQYESWTLPLSIILIVPMCLLSATVGLLIMGMDNNIMTQIGLVVLVGLASKNAILLVEFAKQHQDLEGLDRWQAAVAAARTRLRPILMTALSFILGVIPLLLATGPGFEMRRAIGLTVFSGMLGVTLFGLLLTPVFYVLCRKLAGEGKRPERQVEVYE